MNTPVITSKILDIYDTWLVVTGSFWFSKTINKVMRIISRIFMMFSFYMDGLPFNNIMSVVSSKIYKYLFRFLLFSWDTNSAQWMRNTESPDVL